MLRKPASWEACATGQLAPAAASLLHQPDVDQPLVRIGGLPTRSGGARAGDGRGRPGLKGLVALDRGLDFPMLEHACGSYDGTTLGHRPGGPLRHRHPEVSRLSRPEHRAVTDPDRPGQRNVAAVVGHDADRVNRVRQNLREGRAEDAGQEQEQGRRHEPGLEGAQVRRVAPRAVGGR